MGKIKVGGKRKEEARGNVGDPKQKKQKTEENNGVPRPTLAVPPGLGVEPGVNAPPPRAPTSSPTGVGGDGAGLFGAPPVQRSGASAEQADQLADNLSGLVVSSAMPSNPRA